MSELPFLAGSRRVQERDSRRVLTFRKNDFLRPEVQDVALQEVFAQAHFTPVVHGREPLEDPPPARHANGGAIGQQVACGLRAVDSEAMALHLHVVRKGQGGRHTGDGEARVKQAHCLHGGPLAGVGDGAGSVHLAALRRARLGRAAQADHRNFTGEVDLAGVLVQEIEAQEARRPVDHQVLVSYPGEGCARAQAQIQRDPATNCVALEGVLDVLADARLHRPQEAGAFHEVEGQLRKFGTRVQL